MSQQTRVPAITGRMEYALRAAANPERAVAEKRYLKSDLEFLGVSLPAVRAVVKMVRQTEADLDRAALLELVQALWATPLHERRMAAIELLCAFQDRLTPAEMQLVERLLHEASTWAFVDPLAVDIAGTLVTRYPHLAGTLDRWAIDTDFWLRRAAMLALLRPLRQGEGDFARFSRYADAMLGEKEFFIRKAIGWILREVSKKRPDVVYTWLVARADRASGVTVREAVKYLRPEQRAEALRAYGARRRAP